MSNRVHLSAIPELPLAQIASLSAEELFLLREELAEAERVIKTQRAALGAAIDLKYAFHDVTERARYGKNFGVIRYADPQGGFEIVSDIEKKVEWNQAELVRIGRVITEKWAGARIEDYMTITYDVSERRYSAWPPDLQAIFNAARTTRPGTKKLTIKRRTV